MIKKVFYILDSSSLLLNLIFRPNNYLQQKLKNLLFWENNLIEMRSLPPTFAGENGMCLYLSDLLTIIYYKIKNFYNLEEFIQNRLISSSFGYFLA